MDKFGDFIQFGYAMTKKDKDDIDNEGNKIIIQKGTLVILLDLHEDGCIVEYSEYNNPKINITVDCYDYDELEAVSDEEAKMILKEKRKNKS